MTKINLAETEFSVNSQNGEDGILEVLSSHLLAPNSIFLEIGCSDGNENNSTYLLKKNWTGVAVDASKENIQKFAKTAEHEGWLHNLKLVASTVTWSKVPKILEILGNREPDIFSLDVDSIDYYLMYRFIEEGFRPKVVCVEFNPFLGNAPITVVYNEHFSRYSYQPGRGLYFGVSLAAYRYLLERQGYAFVGVNKDGCNAFFVRRDAMDDETLNSFEFLDFAYTTVFLNKYRKSGEELQRELLSTDGLRFVNVEKEDMVGEVQRYLRAHPPQQKGVRQNLIAQKGAHPTTPPKDLRPLFKSADEREVPVFHGVTTFHEEGYYKAGKFFIESFERYWPKETKLWVMAENCSPPETEKVQVRDLLASCPDLVNFKSRHSSNPGAQGRFGDFYDYQLDAPRWSHKVYAVEAAAGQSDADILIYVDSDIVCFRSLSLDFLVGLMPDWADIGYMPRKKMYSECSFVLYRIKRPEVRAFIKEHSLYYTSDKIFRLPRWTDCHVFDRLVIEYSKAKRLQFFNLNEGIPDSMHPFVNGPLGGYMDHLKGNRKTEGQSRASDLVVNRQEEYWKKAQN